jgi:hypothetical protein
MESESRGIHDEDAYVKFSCVNISPGDRGDIFTDRNVTSVLHNRRFPLTGFDGK